MIHVQKVCFSRKKMKFFRRKTSCDQISQINEARLVGLERVTFWLPIPKISKLELRERSLITSYGYTIGMVEGNMMCIWCDMIHGPCNYHSTSQNASKCKLDEYLMERESFFGGKCIGLINLVQMSVSMKTQEAIISSPRHLLTDY